MKGLVLRKGEATVEQRVGVAHGCDAEKSHELAAEERSENQRHEYERDLALIPVRPDCGKNRRTIDPRDEQQQQLNQVSTVNVGMAGGYDGELRQRETRVSSTVEV